MGRRPRAKNESADQPQPLNANGDEADSNHVEVTDRKLGYYDYTSSDPADWRPWGLYDDKFIPPPLEAARSKALEQLKTDHVADQAALRGRLTGIAVRYWEIRRSVERPPLKWYRDNIEAVRKTFVEALKVLKKKHRGLSGLNRLMQIEMSRPLMKGTGRSGTSKSAEELLNRVVWVCDKMLRQRDKSGRPKNWPVREAARLAAKLWRQVHGKKIGLSLDVGSDKNWKLEPSTQVFLYPGPLFVQTVLQGIDPALDVTEIRTALRHVLKPKRKRKLKGKRKLEGKRKL